MKENIKKRGRPSIEPWMDNLVASRVSVEKGESPDKWTPRNILAYEIQKEIRAIKRPDERLPKISTLEKRISSFRKIVSSEDDIWTIGTSDICPISPEALPEVLAVCKHARGLGNLFTIGQAKWTARLSAIFGNQSPSELWRWTTRYAGAEAVSRLLDRPLDTATLDAQLMGVAPEEWTKEQLEARFRATALEFYKQLEEKEQSRPKYPPAIWELENPEEEQSTNQSKAKKQKRDKGGKK